MKADNHNAYRKQMIRKARRLERSGAPKTQVEATLWLADHTGGRVCNCGAGHDHDGSGYCGY